MDGAANVRQGGYRGTTRSGAARQDEGANDYQRRYRVSTRSDTAREAHSHRHGTSSPSPKRVQNSHSSETDEEDSESQDSGSSDNEQKREVQKRLMHNYIPEKGDTLIHNAYSGKSEKSTRDTLIHSTYSGIPEKSTRDTLIRNASSGTREKSTRDTLIHSTYSGTREKSTGNTPIRNRYSRIPEKYISSTQTNMIIISIIILVAVITASFLLDNNELSLEERKSQLQDRFREIRKQFPTQNDDLWDTLLAGIKKVEDDPSQPSTFLLLYEVEDETPKCLAVKTSKAATEFLKATDPSPLKLEGEELGANDSLINDHGILISEQKENITNHRAMIVFNLHKIPASVAQGFHYFCDEYNPVVQKAVYFFTMRVGKKLHSRPTYVAELELKKLWQQQLETDKLQPLIVRLTTSVMVIKPEKRLVSACDS